MKDRGGNVAASSSICSNVRSLTQVNFTRSVKGAKVFWNSIAQYRSSGVAPSTTTMWFVSGASSRMSSTRPATLKSSPTKVAFLNAPGGSVRRSIPV